MRFRLRKTKPRKVQKRAQNVISPSNGITNQVPLEATQVYTSIYNGWLDAQSLIKLSFKGRGLV